MKKLLTILLCISFVPTFAQPYRTEQDMRKNPMDIVDYYLILPGKPYHVELHNNIDGIEEIEFRKMYLRPMPDIDVIVDKKNAYMKITDEGHGLTYSIELTYFTLAKGKRIIAVNEYQGGGDCESRKTAFYFYEEGEFKDVTQNILPPVSIHDFCVNANVNTLNFFNLQFKLPQHGTTIELYAQPLCEQDEKIRGNANRYFAYWNTLVIKPIELAWDKYSGVFTK